MLYDFEEKLNKLYLDNNNNNSIFENYDQTLCVIIGLENFKNKLSSDLKSKIDMFFKKGKITGKINFIFVDSIDKIKSIEYEPWYKECVTNNSGIWIGNGISEQFTLKLSKTPKYLYDELQDNFGYVIKRGVPIQIKLIEMEKPPNNIELISF